MSSLEKKVLKKACSSLPPLHFKDKAEMPSRKSGRDYSPLPWSDFFHKKDDVHVGNDTYRIYFRGSNGPLLFLLHGGGHSALSWAVFAVEVTKRIQCQVISVDMRGHGNTFTESDGDLSVEVLVSDIARIFTTVCGNWSPLPPVVLIGHSMGGAIAIRAAAAKVIPSLVGLSVIDVVEGTAIESLTGMQSFLQSLPKSFGSLKHAIEWSIKSNHLRNLQSARVSMPGQLRRLNDKDIGDIHVHMTESAAKIKSDVIFEDESETENSNTPDEIGKKCWSDANESYTWRINLSLTAPYWKEWFQDLSTIFLSLPVPKLLILAGIERLDKELTIGHMQGKFQLNIMSASGHVVHEDVPDKVADAIAGFLVRYKLTEVETGFQRLLLPTC